MLLCDRGPMDGKAYLSDEKWQKILNERGESEADLRDTRYVINDNVSSYRVFLEDHGMLIEIYLALDIMLYFIW